MESRFSQAPRSSDPNAPLLRGFVGVGSNLVGPRLPEAGDIGTEMDCWHAHRLAVVELKSATMTVAGPLIKKPRLGRLPAEKEDGIVLDHVQRDVLPRYACSHP